MASAVLVMPRPKRGAYSDPLLAMMERRLIGQSAALTAIVPFVEIYRAGLSPEGRPAGVFLLLGPTGTGKTKTVEVLADCLHGTEKKVLRIDCGEFQSDHEVSKLIGAPPGYLGHKETKSRLNQDNLTAVTSPKSSLALVCFDEIEKAAPALVQLLLGVLDKATLTLGNNTAVDFQRAMIFLTSNLGAREMLSHLKPAFGFGNEIANRQASDGSTGQMQKIGMRAVKKRFSPEFVNRIDSVVAYEPLTATAIAGILDLQLAALQIHINRRKGVNTFVLEFSKAARLVLIGTGTSVESGARELKRTIHRVVLQPLVGLLNSGRISPGSTVLVGADGTALKFRVRPA